MSLVVVRDTKALSNSASSTCQRGTLLSNTSVTVDASRVPSLEAALDKAAHWESEAIACLEGVATSLYCMPNPNPIVPS